MRAYVCLHDDFPDPAVLETESGFWAYATQTHGSININTAFSKNMLDWEYCGESMPVQPKWLQGRKFIWAPHVIEHHGKYIMFYSGECEESGKDCWPIFGMGVAISDHPSGPFVDIGYPLFKGTEFQDIDPMVFMDEDKKYLYYGSGWHSIRVRELSAGLLLPVTEPVDLLWPSDSKYEKLIEAAWVHKHGDWYYLFYSGDNATTWTPEPSYAVLVARSRSPMGPFEKKGKAILESCKDWLAPGHCSVLECEDQTYMAYHAIDRADMFCDNGEVKRKFLISSLSFGGEWPIVEEVKDDAYD